METLIILLRWEGKYTLQWIIICHIFSQVATLSDIDLHFHTRPIPVIYLFFYFFFNLPPPLPPTKKDKTTVKFFAGNHMRSFFSFGTELNFSSVSQNLWQGV